MLNPTAKILRNIIAISEDLVKLMFGDHDDPLLVITVVRLILSTILIPQCVGVSRISGILQKVVCKNEH